MGETRGNFYSTGCGRFFCVLAKGRGQLTPKRFAELKEALGCILRNMARVGDCVAVRSLMEALPERQALLLLVDGLGLGLTALHLAAANGHHLTAQALMENIDADGYRPLHLAAQAGHWTVARVLLEFAADRWAQLAAPDKSEYCRIPLHLAAMSGHEKVAQTLLQMAPSSAALNFAAQQGHDLVVRELLEWTPHRDYLLTTCNKHDRRTPLHLAADSGHEAVTRVLVGACSDKVEQARLLETLDGLGETALHLCAARGHSLTAQIILSFAPENGVLFRIREWLFGQTALHFAADNGHDETCRVLLHYAPDPRVALAMVDKYGQNTALHLAAEKGRTSALRAMLEMAPQPNKGALLKMSECFCG